MSTKKISNFCLLAWYGIIVAAALPGYTFAGDVQVINVFDKRTLNKDGMSALERMAVGEILGKNLTVQVMLVEGETSPSKGKAHNHPQEHFWIQMAGTTEYMVEVTGQGNRFYKGETGFVMHMPPYQQHRGKHGMQDAYLVTVTPSGKITGLDSVPPGMTSRDHYDTFDLEHLKDVELTELKKGQVYTRRGKLGEGLGEEAVLIKKEASKHYSISAHKPPAAEVAIVYSGHVKVTGCGETRELGRGDILYCPGGLTYAGLGKEDSKVMRVFTPANSDFFIAKP